MQITSLIDILDGELQNSPSISFIYDLKTKITKFKEGDAIISNNQSDISKAIAKGAFGVIYSSSHIDISDSEIAWIKVKDLHQAIIRLSRYLLSNTRVKSYTCDRFTFEMLEIYKKLAPKTVFLDDNISKNFEKIKLIENGFSIFSFDEVFLNQILPITKAFKASNYKVKNVVEHSLFEVSFSYKNNFINRLKLPIIYLRNFIETAEYYGFENIQAQKLKKFKHMNAVFINKNSEVVDFGKSDKFIITQNNKSSLALELNFLNTRFTYGKKIFLLPKSFKNSLNFECAIFYDSKSQIKEIINHSSYNCLYIYGIGEDKLESFLEPSYLTKSLF